MCVWAHLWSADLLSMSRRRGPVYSLHILSMSACHRARLPTAACHCPSQPPQPGQPKPALSLM
eukprot:gene10509-2637_t